MKTDTSSFIDADCGLKQARNLWFSRFFRLYEIPPILFPFSWCLSWKPGASLQTVP